MNVVFLVLFSLFLAGCTPYFTIIKNKDTSSLQVAQQSRMHILTQRNLVKTTIRMTHLNPFGNILFRNKEYFFVEIYSKDDSIFLPYFIEYRLFKKKAIWVREIRKDEYDGLFYVNNDFSRSFLVAFDKVSSFDQKNIKVSVTVNGYDDAFIFNFSYIIMRSFIGL